MKIEPRAGPLKSACLIFCDWCASQFNHRLINPELPLHLATAGWKVNVNTGHWICPACIREGWVLEAGPGIFAKKVVESVPS